MIVTCVRDTIQNMISIQNTDTERLLSELEKLPYFTFEALSRLSEKPYKQCWQMVNRWRKKGYLTKLKKGIYTTKSYYGRHISDMDYIPSIASILNPISYLSLEYILQKHNILTDATYTITSVTTKPTTKYLNDVGGFYYKSIKTSLYAGFICKNYYGITVNEATLEKALFDYMYFRPIYNRGRVIKTDVVEELRLNLEVFTEEQITSFSNWCEVSGLRKMRLVNQNFKENIWKKI